MIDCAYVTTMARYNSWQNAQLSDLLEGMEAGDLRADRGAFFGSILGTLNHLLWGDRMWMSRWYDPVERPSGGIPDSLEETTDLPAWRTARREMDGHISDWAASLSEADLAGDLVWYSGATGKEQRRPLWLCVTHFFNHQTHHRGQLHAMLTATGRSAPVSDLVFMPEDAGWP
ncbi:MAG: DinB family protein [Sulfitobacter sp.]|nr:DinB family protein [Sulfitobacter sp.]